MLRNLKEFKLPEIEEKVLKFWKENRIFEKSLALRQAQGKESKIFRFFEGPPTANGRPGIHHVLGRAFKDVIPRFKTMQGYLVNRKAGWDTHGLPVEIEVEKELGLKNKQEIEKFGIAEFNEKAKSSVWKYQDEWEKLTDRIGFWLDMKNPYITYKPDYIESLWWVLKQISDRGLLSESFKIVPYCPRCQTPLSSHEMGQPGVYKKAKDPSVYVKFEIRNPKSETKKTKTLNLKPKTYLLVWTTTPWTLPSNVAVAVNPELSYTKYSAKGGSASGGKIEYIWSYGAPPKIDGVEYDVVEKISGKKMIGWEYEPMFKVNGPWLKNKKFFRVYGAGFVSTTDGTGLVHIAPAFGEDDMQLIQQVLQKTTKNYRLQTTDIPITIDNRGIVQAGLPGAGRFAKQADKDIIAYLADKKILLKSEEIEHDYPFCWRCGTPILYFSRFSWFIEMSGLRNQLLKNNEKINWVPEHIKEGRFGEWLKDVKDWAISRDRYWGTPLPIWRCQMGKFEIRNTKSETNSKLKTGNTKQRSGCGEIKVIGSLKELDENRFSENNFYFLRHGESDHNLTGIIAAGPERGKNISKLTEKGMAQADEAGKNIKKMFGNGKLDLIIASPYYRTKQTAKAVAKHAKARIIFDKRLVEIDTGIFNWRPVGEFHKFFEKPLDRFTKAPAGGENLNDVKKRMFSALLDINAKYSGKNILIVSHGDPLWVLEGAMKGLTNEEILKLDYIETDGKPRKVELHNWPYNMNCELDLHRPYVDNLYLKCGKCDGKMTRVKEVADVWFDSGAMPFAQFHYPFTCERSLIDADSNADQRRKNISVNARNYLQESALRSCIDFPADYISEGIDQTRGWFYTLLAVATALGLENPYKNVITLGLVLDKNGQKMSKSKGNAVSPWDMIQKYGADVVRWYFYTINPPSESKKFDELDLGKMLRKFIMIIYNSFVFLETYGQKVQSSKFKVESSNVLDRWILARLNQTIGQATEGLEKYDVGSAGKALESFADDLSRWYIRRSRPRLQRPDDMKDYANASATLGFCLLELSKLLAPFTPFFADALYMSLADPVKSHSDHGASSVHLASWPEADKKATDFPLLEKMEEVRRLSSLALAIRAENGVKVRQPLQKLEVKSKKLDVRDEELLAILRDEVNVKEIKWNYEMEDELAFDLVITPELKEEGLLREVVRMVQGLRHDANYVPADAIELMIEGSTEVENALNAHMARLKNDVGAKKVELKKSAKFDAELNSKLEDQPVWIGVRKIK